MTGLALTGRRGVRTYDFRGSARWFAIGGCASVLTGLLLSLAPMVPIGVLAIATAVGLYLSAPAGMLLALLALRPSLEGVAESIAFGGVNALGLMSAGTAVGGAGYLAIRRPTLPRTIPLLGAAFSGWALISLLWSSNRADGVSDWLSFSVYIVVFCVAAAVVRNVSQARTLIFVILASMVIPICVGVAQVALGVRLVKEGYAAIPGLAVHPNSFGQLLLVGISFGMVAFFEERDRLRKRLLAVGLALGGVCFFLTYARAAWLACALVLAALAVFRYRRLIIVSVVAVVLAAALSPSLLGQVTGRFADLSPGSAGYGNNSLSWRVTFWERMWPYATERPVTGQGIGTFLPLSNEEIGVFDYRFQTPEGSAANVETYPHNDYLWIFTELGLPGLVLWVALLLSLTGVAWRVRHIPELYPYGIALAALMAGVIALSATDNVKSSIGLLLTLFAVGGALTGATTRRPGRPHHDVGVTPRAGPGMGDVQT